MEAFGGLFGREETPELADEESAERDDEVEVRRARGGVKESRCPG